MQNEESASLLINNIGDEEEKEETVWPFNICLPVFLSVVTAAMIFGIQQQWVLQFLCARFVNLDGKSFLPVLSAEYLPGTFNSYPIINPHPEWESCRKVPEVQIAASHWTLALSLTSGLPSLLMGPVYGMLSDRLGRKPFILMGMFSALLFYAAYVAISFLNLGMWLLLIASTINGLLGSYYILLTNTLAYFADTSSSEKRGKVFIIGESVFFGGFAIGPLLGGYLARQMPNGPIDVFLIAFIAKLLVLIGTTLYLPESLRVQKKRSSSDSSLADKTLYEMAQKTIVNVCNVFRDAATPSFFGLLAGFIMIVSCAGSGRLIFFYYVSLTFGWDSQDEGQLILAAAGSRMFHMLVSYPLLTKVFKAELAIPQKKVMFDLTFIRVGVYIASFSALMQALATVSWYLYIIAIFDGFAALVSPNIQSLLSASVPKTTQALLFSGITFSSQVISLIFAAIMPVVWSNTARSKPNAFLYLVSLFYALAGVSLLFGVSGDALLAARDRVRAAELEEQQDVPVNSDN